MVEKVDPAFGYSAPRGWKIKQQQARLKAQRHTKHNREQIRAIRKAHYERQKSLPEPKAVAIYPNPNNMTRAELIDEIKLAGGHADSKMSTAVLIQRVESLRGA